MASKKIYEVIAVKKDGSVYRYTGSGWTIDETNSGLTLMCFQQEDGFTYVIPFDNIEEYYWKVEEVLDAALNS